MKYYISGPMTNIIAFNFPAFARAAAQLRAAGLDVLSAHEVDHGEHTGTGTAPWTEYLRRDLKAMLDCGAIVLLEGWERSRGAQLELYVARALEFEIFLGVEEALAKTKYRPAEPKQVIPPCGHVSNELRFCVLEKGHLQHHNDGAGNWWRRRSDK